MKMAAVDCPIPEFNFSTADSELVLAAAQLNLHALTHIHMLLRIQDFLNKNLEKLKKKQP